MEDLKTLITKNDLNDVDLKRIISRSSIVYFNGLTVKDRNFKPSISYFNLVSDGLNEKVRIDFWDEKNQILSLKSNY